MVGKDNEVSYVEKRVKTFGDGKTVISKTVKYDGNETLYKVENGVEVHMSFYCGECEHVYPDNTTRDGHSFKITDYKCDVTDDNTPTGDNDPLVVVGLMMIMSLVGLINGNKIKRKS